MIYLDDMDKQTRAQFDSGNLKTHQNIQAKVKEVISPERITLTQLSEINDPWFGIQNRYEEGKRYKATVKNIKGNKMFLELEPGIFGVLILPKNQSIDNFKNGQVLDVVLTKLDRKNRKIFFAK